MKTLMYSGPNRKRALMTRVVMLTAALCSLFTLRTQTTFAQGQSQTLNIKEYVPSPPPTPEDYDVKQYAVEMVVPPTSTLADETVLAGTIYHDTWGWVTGVNFLRLDAAGNVLANTEFQSATDIDYQFRSVDIATSDINTHTHFITCYGQYNQNSTTDPPPPGTPWNGSTVRDKIRVLAVDDNGALRGAIDIMDITPITPPLGTDGDHLIPTNSLYVQVGGERILFICGIAYRDYNDITQAPIANYKGDKRSFVIAINVGDPANMMQRKGMVYNTDWNAVAAPLASNNPWDFDMAFRVKDIKYGSYATNGATPGIFLAGSCNAYTGSADIWSAATNYVLQADPTSPNFLEFYVDFGILHTPNGDGFTDHEYGIDVIEDPDGSHNRSYLLTNYFNDPVHQHVPSTLNAMDPGTYAMIVSAVERDFAIVTGTPRIRYSNLFGIQTLTSKTTPFNSSYFSFEIAGLLHNDVPQAAYPPIPPGWDWANWGPPTDWPINPTIFPANRTFLKAYILDIAVDLTSPIYNPSYYSSFTIPNQPHTIYAELNSLTVFDNITSTGASNYPNNYHELGTWANPINNMYWNPVFAARGLYNDDHLYLTAPQWHGPNSAGNLRLKWIKGEFDPAYTPPTHMGITTATNPQYSDNNCSARDVYITHPQVEEYITNAIIPTTEEMALDVTPVTPPSVDVDEDVINCTANYYKTNSIADAKNTTAESKFYPNPAAGSVNLTIAAGIKADAMIKVQLINLQGQVVTTLYNGKASGANQSYNLPQLPAGMYIAQVYADGAIVHQQKLVVQQ